MAEALIIVDFQNDFTAGGALAVPGGEEIAPRLNALATDPRYELVVATRDWHPRDHGSFAAAGGPWPEHCVQGSEGAELHPALERAAIDVVIDKGQDRQTEGYSGFDATALADLLRARDVDAVTVVGLATDYCVKHTALEARRLGFDVEVDEHAVRGVDSDGSRLALEQLRSAGVRVGTPGPA
jgi:nicotinamidase/pyrazinamidase